MHSIIAVVGWVPSILLMYCSVTAEAYLSCPEVGSANFEGDGWSGYTTTNNTGLSWIRSDHQMGRNRPAADVTYRNSSGHYLFLDTASYSNGYTALLRSPHITLPNTFQEDCYVSFHYSMNSDDSGSLTVYTIDDGSQIPSPVSWSRVGNQCTGNGWVFGQAKLLHGSTTGFAMYFNGTAINQTLVGSGNGDGIGLDDISINCCSGCGSSNPLRRATFSSGFDGFQQSPHDDFYWTRNSGETPSPGTGPQYDHTVGNGGCPSSSVDGHYIHIEASSQASNGSASLVSPVITPPAIESSVCFISFWYNMFGDGIGSLTVSALDTGNHEVCWCRHGAQQRNQASWLKAVLWIQPNETNFQVNINGTGTVNGGFRGDIAVDDIEVSCCLESCHNFEYVTFECSNQGFSLNHNGKAWFYNTTGPDHTSGLGNGRFMQSTESQMIGVERTLPNRSGYNCSIFFYMWIDGPSDGAVSVSFSTVNGASTLEVWTLQSAGVPQSDWFQPTAIFTVPAGERSFRLTWISTKNATSSWTDMRLDDVQLICCPSASTSTDSPYMSSPSRSRIMTTSEQIQSATLQTISKVAVVTLPGAITFVCNYTGDPAPTISIETPASSNRTNLNIATGFTLTGIQYTAAQLVISPSTIADNGTYTCVATVGSVTTRTSSTVIVQDVPGAPSTPTARCIEAQIVIVEWSEPDTNNAPITEYAVKYEILDYPGSFKTATFVLDPRARSLAIPFYPALSYSITVRATNMIGVGNFSRPLRITTSRLGSSSSPATNLCLAESLLYITSTTAIGGFVGAAAGGALLTLLLVYVVTHCRAKNKNSKTSNTTQATQRNASIDTLPTAPPAGNLMQVCNPRLRVQARMHHTDNEAYGLAARSEEASPGSTTQVSMNYTRSDAYGLPVGSDEGSPRGPEASYEMIPVATAPDPVHSQLSPRTAETLM